MIFKLTKLNLDANQIIIKLQKTSKDARQISSHSTTKDVKHPWSKCVLVARRGE